jgi:short-subunit dehydrogenase
MAGGKVKMKRYIVTGASDGLGAEFGKICNENGIEVVYLSRTGGIQGFHDSVQIKTVGRKK